MNKRYGAAMLALACARSVGAHDFWVQPERFLTVPDAPMALTLQVGHGAERQRSQIPVRRITRFAAIAPDGAISDLRPALHPGEEEGDGVLVLRQPGVHVVVLETDGRAQSHLAAPRFNDYLREEGLTPVLALRERTGAMGVEGSESYSRCAKALVRVGGDSAGQASMPAGLPLEIVPAVNPYAASGAQRLPVDVLYFGQPLAGALVKLTNLDQDAAPVETQVTGAGGRAEFTLPRTGRWMLNVVWTSALPKGGETDYATVFSSLSFGFQ